MNLEKKFPSPREEASQEVSMLQEVQNLGAREGYDTKNTPSFVGRKSTPLYQENIPDFADLGEFLFR